MLEEGLEQDGDHEEANVLQEGKRPCEGQLVALVADREGCVEEVDDRKEDE